MQLWLMRLSPVDEAVVAVDAHMLHQTRCDVPRPVDYS